MRSDDFTASEQELEHCCQLRDDRVIRLIIVAFITVCAVGQQRRNGYYYETQKISNSAHITGLNMSFTGFCRDGNKYVFCGEHCICR